MNPNLDPESDQNVANETFIIADGKVEESPRFDDVVVETSKSPRAASEENVAKTLVAVKDKEGLTTPTSVGTSGFPAKQNGRDSPKALHG